MVQTTPLLYTFYFGESASGAQQGASRRLQKWARAFDQWYAERATKYKPNTVKQMSLAWKRLTRHLKKMPWEIDRQDLESHIRWLKDQGLSDHTINCSIGTLSSFYDWCDLHHTDRFCPAGFNPAREVQRIKIPRYAVALIWNQGEVDALMSLVQRDTSTLGKRDYAFFLARLNLGVQLKSLLHLRWSQLRFSESTTWVTWRAGTKSVELPGEVWRAIEDYLESSGRRAKMHNQSIIFAGTADRFAHNHGEEPTWVEDRPMYFGTMRYSLKLYGRRAGIHEAKLNFTALHNTAVYLKLAQGADTHAMQQFLNSNNKPEFIKYALHCLQANAAIDPLVGQEFPPEPEVPYRYPNVFKEGDQVTHGFSSRVRDLTAIQQLQAQDIRGVDTELANLRRLMQGVIDRHIDEAGALDVYSNSGFRLGRLVTFSERATNESDDTWVQEMLRVLSDVALEHGMPDPTIGLIAGSSSDSQEDLDTGCFDREIATLRWMLGNVYLRAMSGVSDHEYLRLLDLYGVGCMRLLRMLSALSTHPSGQLASLLNRTIDQAIAEVYKEHQVQKENDRDDS